jgi:hypothetical protein
MNPAFGPRAGQKVLSLQSVPSLDAQHTQKRFVSEQGFSFHAEMCCAMSKRKKTGTTVSLHHPPRYRQ